MTSDDRSTTQRTLDLLREEWTQPYREALKNLLEALLHVDVQGQASAMADYEMAEHEAVEIIATEGRHP